MQENDSDIPSVHKLLEWIALVALFEAWNKPFEVKLVRHEGDWVLRLRFRGEFGKSDLLIRFDVAAAREFLNDKKLPEHLEKMRAVLYSFSLDGLSQREMGKDYRDILADKQKFPVPLDPITIANIKRALLSRTDPKEFEKDLAQNLSLADKEISWNNDAEILLGIGMLIFKHYHHNAALRHQLCWRVVHKCIINNGCSEASVLVEKLREKGEVPTEGYPALFAHVVLKKGNSSDLYKFCSPFPSVNDEFWQRLVKSDAKAECLITLMNEMDISAELFLEMALLVKIKYPVMGEKILCKVIVHDRKRASEWILKNDKPEFVSEEYNLCLSQHIMVNKRDFDPEWIKNYLFRKKFILSNTDRVALCQYLLSKPLKVQDKADLLHTLEIQDDSLWQTVVNEYIGQGESWPPAYNEEAKIDPVSSLLWHQIIRAPEDTDFVRKALKQIEERRAGKKELEPPPKKTKDAIREFVLIGILKIGIKKESILK